MSPDHDNPTQNTSSAILEWTPLIVSLASVASISARMSFLAMSMSLGSPVFTSLIPFLTSARDMVSRRSS